MAKARTIYRSGGSSVVSLPPALMKEVGLGTGDDVGLEVEENSIKIYPIEFTEAHRAEGGEA